ncbi:MAG: hypothetical protein WC866_01390 [Patescibacteria group bacterium]|jgi:thymidylate kinase
MEKFHEIELRISRCLTRFRRLRRNNPRIRPFVVELLGTPKSGKTTIAEAIEHTLKRNDGIVTARPEGATVVDRVKRDTPHYNLETCRYALSEVTQRLESDLDLIILDRGLMDGMIWMEYWQKRGDLSEDDYAKAIAFYGMEIFRDLFDLHVLLVCEPEVAMQRELAKRRSKKDGDTMNLGTIQKLRGYHDNLWTRLDGNSDHRMSMHDSSRETSEETLDVVLAHMADVFERRLVGLK